MQYQRPISALLLYFVLIALEYLAGVWCPYLLSSLWILWRCTRLYYWISRLSPSAPSDFPPMFFTSWTSEILLFLLQEVYPNFPWKIIYKSNIVPSTSNGCYWRRPPHICVYEIKQALWLMLRFRENYSMLPTHNAKFTKIKFVIFDTW